MNNQYTYLVAYTITSLKNEEIENVPLNLTWERENKVSSSNIEILRESLESNHSKELGHSVTVSFQNFMLL